MPALTYQSAIKTIGSSTAAFLYLLHGANEELKSDLAVAIRKSKGIGLDDAFRFVRLDGDELEADPGRLPDELSAISMFGGSRLIEVKASARQAGRIVAQALGVPRGDYLLVVDAADLSEADWLNETMRTEGLISVACGEERPGDFHTFVIDEFARAGLSIDEQAVETLILLVGDERAGIRSEIEKLSALLGPGARITLKDIKDVVADASSMLADEVAAAALAGDCDGLARILDRLKVAGSDPVQALGAAHRQSMSLYRARIRQWGGRSDPHMPPWSAAEARYLVRSLGAAVHQTRTDSANAALLAERTLVALGQTARLKRL